MNILYSSLLAIHTRLEGLAVLLAGIALFVMALVGIGDILLPKLLNLPLPGVFELSESLMVVCIFMPLAWTESRQGHIRMGILRTLLPPKGRKMLDCFVALFGLGFYGVLAWQGWILAWRSTANRESAAGLISFPLYPAKILLATGLSLMVLKLLSELLQTMTAHTSCFRESVVDSGLSS